MTDSLLFAIGCGVTSVAFGGVYVYLRGSFQRMGNTRPYPRGRRQRRQARGLRQMRDRRAEEEPSMGGAS